MGDPLGRVCSTVLCTLIPFSLLFLKTLQWFWKYELTYLHKFKKIVRLFFRTQCLKMKYSMENVRPKILSSVCRNRYPLRNFTCLVLCCRFWPPLKFLWKESRNQILHFGTNPNLTSQLHNCCTPSFSSEHISILMFYRMR